MKKKSVPYKRLDQASRGTMKAEKFKDDGWATETELEWICAHCNHGADDPEEARFYMLLAQWYEWDMDGLGERRTRYSINCIDPPQKGSTVTCRNCSKTFKLKEKKK